MSRRGRLSLLSALLGLGVVVATLLVLRGSLMAAPPSGGNPISFADAATIPVASSGVIRTLATGDLDLDGYVDLVYGQVGSLTLQRNTGLTTTVWAPAVAIDLVDYPLRDVLVVDIDRDGAKDVAAVAADGAGNSQLSAWQNPGNPFASAWSVSNTVSTGSMSLTSLAAGDLDRNGTPDLVSGGLDGMLRLWSNPLTGTQSFLTSWSVAATISTSGDQIRRIVVVDLDRDGWLDIVEAAGDGSSGSVRLWQNPGDPFSTAWTVNNTLSTSPGVYALAVGDLDNDGALDIVAGLANGQVVTWRSPLDGTQPFTASWGASAAIGDLALPTYGLAVMDADRDGRRDVVAAGMGSPSVATAWRNRGTPFSGGWSGVTLDAPADEALVLAAADFNRDGDLDVVIGGGDTGGDTGSMQFWTNDLIRSSGRFETPNVGDAAADALSASELHAMDVHDLDRDGLPDIAVATLDGSLILLRNDGTPFSTGGWPYVVAGHSSGFFAVSVGDLDGDGWPDIATSTTLTGSGGLVHIWQNDHTPFSGTWISQTAGAFPRQVMDLALGDVTRQGDVQIVAATGITTTFEEMGSHDVPTSADNALWLLRPPSGDPFASEWISSTMCATEYSANSVALGDLDGDGWTDVVFGTDHAPLGTTSWPDTSGFYAGPAYQVRACRNLGSPDTPAGWQTYDLGRDDATVSAEYLHHGFWGAHVFGVAVGDLDHDGDLDVTSVGGAEGDHQILVYENDGTPFDGAIWSPTAVGYGSRTDGGSAFCPGGSYPAGCPWLEAEMTSVDVGDVNNDGWPDLVSGFDGFLIQLPVWFNSGDPFGATVTDSSWRRVDLGFTPSCSMYGVELADLDRDGRTDVTAVSSGAVGFPGPLRVWRNLGGIARHHITPSGITTVEDGASASWLAFSIRNNGRAYDHGIEVQQMQIRLLDSLGLMTDTRGSSLLQSMQIYRDANGDDVWQISDTPVVTVSDFSFAVGYQIFAFPTGEPAGVISPSQTITYFVVLNLQPTASVDYGTVYSATDFRVSYVPHTRLLIRDVTTLASVSIEEDAQVLTPMANPVAAPPSMATASAYPGTITANGTSTATVTATVTTAYNYPVLDGTVVTFTTSAGSLPSVPYTTTTVGGVATATLTSGTEVTIAVVTATASSTVFGTAEVTFRSPTVVRLTLFDAVWREGQVVVSWSTASELGTLGFNLWRSTSSDGDYVQVNETLIASELQGGDLGADYEYLDNQVTPGQVYYYKLEEVEAGGATYWYGPVSTGILDVAKDDFRVFVPLVFR